MGHSEIHNARPVSDIGRFPTIDGEQKIAPLLGENVSDETDSVLLQALNDIERAALPDSTWETMNLVANAREAVEGLANHDLKKYQKTIISLISARSLHLIAVYECMTHASDLAALTKTGDTFAAAIDACKDVASIRKTFLTDRRQLIERVRQAAKDEKKKIRQSKTTWKRQLRQLHRRLNPWKYRVPVIIVLSVLIAVALFFFKNLPG